MTENKREMDELINILNGISQTGEDIVEVGQSLIRTGQLMRDSANCFREILSELPRDLVPPSQITQSVQSWQALQLCATTSDCLYDVTNSLAVATSGAINTTVSMLNLNDHSPTSLPESARLARDRLSQVLDSSNLVDRVKAAMARLGLDRSGGSGRTALEFLNESQSGLKTPVTNGLEVTSVLISLRSSIDASITELTRRKPQQEKAGKWHDKVLFLGRQCGIATSPPGHFERLASRIGQIMDRLSGAKTTSMTREQLLEQFHEGITFLDAFLGSIDESKLRSGR